LDLGETLLKFAVEIPEEMIPGNITGKRLLQ